MSSVLYHSLAENPMIAAVKSEGELEKAVQSPVECIFLLGGNICQLEGVVALSRAQDKQIYLHMDLMDGLGRDFYALKYLQERVRPDGVITTKTGLVRHAKEFGLFVIQRLFMLDSMSLELGIKTIHSVEPDAVEILPGIIPSIIAHMHGCTKIPLIAGGLTRTKQETIDALKAGAVGVSTSKQPLWHM